MRTFRQQRGMGFLPMLIIFAMVAAIGLFGMKTLPLYIENSSVNAALDSLIGVPNIGKQGKRAMIKRIDGQLYIDAVERFSAKQLIFVKSKDKKSWIVTADYEAKADLVKNLSVVVHFVKTVEVSR